MFRKKLLLLLFFVLGCAKPRYAEDLPPANKNNPQETVEGQTPSAPSKPEEKPTECPIAWSAHDFCLQWYWEVAPTAKKPGVLVFKFFRRNQSDQNLIAVDPISTPEVVLWMPDMGHGSMPTQTERVEIGTYRTTQVFFIMPGLWEIKFQIKKDNQIIESASLAITI